MGNVLVKFEDGSAFGFKILSVDEWNLFATAFTNYFVEYDEIGWAVDDEEYYWEKAEDLFNRCTVVILTTDEENVLYSIWSEGEFGVVPFEFSKSVVDGLIAEARIDSLE